MIVGESVVDRSKLLLDYPIVAFGLRNMFLRCDVVHCNWRVLGSSNGIKSSVELVVTYNIGYLESAGAINTANIRDGGPLGLCFGCWHVMHGSVVDIL